MINITASGNVGKDSELKIYNGYSCLIFSIASTKKVKGENVTVWINCKIWGDKGDKLQKYIIKGSSLVVNGEGSCDAYLKQDGTAVGSISINVNDLQFMGSTERKIDSDLPVNTPVKTLFNKVDKSNDIPEGELPF